MFTLYYRYRFFYCTISMLLDRDPLLAGEYRKNYRGKYRKLKDLFILLIKKNKVVKKFRDREERKMFLENLWILMDFRVGFKKITGSITEERFVRESTKTLLFYLESCATMPGDD